MEEMEKIIDCLANELKLMSLGANIESIQEEAPKKSIFQNLYYYGWVYCLWI